MTVEVPEYPKINSLWKRDERGNVLRCTYAQPEFEQLHGTLWRWTEKVDGTNIRMAWSSRHAPADPIRGRTDRADVPKHLLNVLVRLYERLPWAEAFLDDPEPPEVVLYGEGYGAKIQKGGGNYNPLGCDFVLFDVLVNGRWLDHLGVGYVADVLGVGVVPPVVICDIDEAVRRVAQNAITSAWSGVRPEGLVGRPLVELYDQFGGRITTKIKWRDLV